MQKYQLHCRVKEKKKDQEMYFIEQVNILNQKFRATKPFSLIKKEAIYILPA